jgi:hypothetical protein
MTNTLIEASLDRDLDEGLPEIFPASDPLAATQPS